MIRFASEDDGYVDAAYLIGDRGVAQARHEYSIHLTTMSRRLLPSGGYIGSDYLRGFSAAIQKAEADNA